MGPTLFTTKRKEAASWTPGAILASALVEMLFGPVSHSVSKHWGGSVSKLGKRAMKPRGDALCHKVDQRKSLSLWLNSYWRGFSIIAEAVSRTPHLISESRLLLLLHLHSSFVCLPLSPLLVLLQAVIVRSLSHVSKFSISVQQAEIFCLHTSCTSLMPIHHGTKFHIPTIGSL